MSFTVMFILVAIAVVVTMGGVIYVLIKDLKQKKKELAEAQARLESARVNIEQLSKYIDKLMNIKADEKSVSEKIKEAESDEEVYNIISDIVNSNNQRVQND